MNDFCFVVTSYNQEKYVFAHLESIKYLVKKYGDNKRIQLVFSDDASNDKTVFYAKKWLEINGTIFSQFEIVEHDCNVGTIRNMIDGISHVNARNYKELSCDDLYYNNNIFEMESSQYITLTPVIHFFEDGEIKYEINPSYKQLIMSQSRGKLKQTIQKMLCYNNCIEAPGVFVPIRIWQDIDFQRYLKQYVYIEDIPEWHYIFNTGYVQVDAKFVTKPYILYRRNVGISTKIKSDNNPIDNIKK